MGRKAEGRDTETTTVSSDTTHEYCPQLRSKDVEVRRGENAQYVDSI